VHWAEQDVLGGDAKANASRARELARGATAYRLEAGNPVERLEQFDPHVMQIIMVHRYRGVGEDARGAWSVWILGLQIGGMTWPITTLEELR